MNASEARADDFATTLAAAREWVLQGSPLQPDLLHIELKQRPCLWNGLVRASLGPPEAVAATILSIPAMRVHAADHEVATFQLLNDTSAIGALAAVRHLPLLVALQIRVPRCRLLQGP